MDNFTLFTKLKLDVPKKKKSKATCQHEIITKNGIDICTLCGEVTYKKFNDVKEWNFIKSKYSSSNIRHQIRKKNVKSIHKDINKFLFEKRISKIANEIYLEITKNQIFRGKMRKAIIYACITYAYRTIDKHRNQEQLLNIFQIDRKYGLKGLSFLNMNIEKKKAISCCNHITPVHIIKNVMKKFNANEDQINNVLKLYKTIKNKSSKINRSRPKSIANSIVFYWIQKNKIDINISQFSKNVMMSELTIKKLVKEIQLIISLAEKNNTKT